MAHKTIYLPVMEPPPAPKTAAQRKAEQRARDKRAVADAIGLESLADVRTLAMLLRESITKDAAHEQRAAYRAWLEIGKKHGWIEKGKVIDPLDPKHHPCAALAEASRAQDQKK